MGFGIFLLLAAPAGAQPAPQPLALLDVPFISQSEALCGGAAAAMVLRYWGARGLTAESFAHLVDRSAAGIRTEALMGELRARGWNAAALEGTDDALAGELARGRPVLTLIQDRPGTFHYIVIVAATAGAVVFHDPARAPLRVMSRDEFRRRWEPADRWMAVIVPGGRPPDGGAAAAVDVEEGGARVSTGDRSCDQLLVDGVERARANDLAAAERSLTAALSCPGPAALRELAGVRLLQRRWPDVEALAGAAVAVAPGDAHAWRLLGTSRFVQEDPGGALDAWNRVEEPRVDLLAVAGLTRTRQRVVERLIGIGPGEVLTPDALTRARRRLQELPSATATRLEYVPLPSSLAELRASVNERPLAPSGVWSYAAIGLVAAARREVTLSSGSLAGGGERLTAAWRFWPDRPRVALSLDAPAPWGGLWGVQAFSERQPFDFGDLPPGPRPDRSAEPGPHRPRTAERSAAGVRLSNWMTPRLRVSLRGGLDRWRDRGTHGVAGAALELRSTDDRVELRLGIDRWIGPTAFLLTDAAMTARSSADRRGRVYVARAGAGAASGSTPMDVWFAGDTGDTRTARLRAHPVVAEGALRTEQLGRRILHASVEAQQWWRVSIAQAGAAVFADAARVGTRLRGPGRTDVDLGIGARLALPGVPGTFRTDLAKGLRDGATSWSFVYEPMGW